MTKIPEKAQTASLVEEEEVTPTPPAENDADEESGIILPEDAEAVEQVAATDRLLSFDNDGNPTTATAEQVKKYTAEGLVDTETLNATLAGKANKNGDAGEMFFANYLYLDSSTRKGVVVGSYSTVLDDDDVYLINWGEKRGDVGLIGAKDPCFVRVDEWIKRTIWHSGKLRRR